MHQRIKVVVPCKSEHGYKTLISDFCNTYKHKLRSLDFDFFDFKIHTNNRKGLPELYNQYLTEEYRDYIIIFAHDDVSITDSEWYSKLSKQFNAGYSVVGIAGSSSVAIRKPTLWHLMNPDTGENHSGAVEHPYTENTRCITNFGPYPQRVILLDGLFIAVKVSDILDKGIKWDESFKFHHYDLDFSLQCHYAGLQLSTCGINIFHQSPGLRSLEDKGWNESQDIFWKKWNK
jgi:hypothetical protein